MFNWNDIRHFLALHRHRTLSAAGASTGSDPSTVARRLAKLERGLGARLFDRSPVGYSLTEAGRRLLDKAEGIEREALAIERDIAGEDQKLDGVVRIAAAEMLMTRFLAPHLRQFRESCPGIQLELRCGSGNVDLSRREADIALRLSRPTNDNVVIKRLAYVDLGLYVSVDFADRHGLPDGSSKEVHPLILFTDRASFRHENDWMATWAPDAPIGLRVDSASAMYTATLAGVGVALLPRLVADRDPKLARLAVEDGPAPREIWQAIHEDVRDNARIRAVADFLGSIVKRDSHARQSQVHYAA